MFLTTGMMPGCAITRIRKDVSRARCDSLLAHQSCQLLIHATANTPFGNPSSGNPNRKNGKNGNTAHPPITLRRTPTMLPSPEKFASPCMPRSEAILPANPPAKIGNDSGNISGNHSGNTYAAQFSLPRGGRVAAGGMGIPLSPLISHSLTAHQTPPSPRSPNALAQH